MNNAPRHALRKIIANCGTDFSSDKKRRQGLLNSLYGEQNLWKLKNVSKDK